MNKEEIKQEIIETLQDDGDCCSYIDGQEPDEKEPIEQYSEYFKDLIEKRHEETVSNIEDDYDAYIDSLPY